MNEKSHADNDDDYKEGKDKVESMEYRINTMVESTVVHIRIIWSR